MYELCGSGEGVNGGPSVTEFVDGGGLTRGSIVGGRGGSDRATPLFKRN